ncbi:hypothetical protein HNP73_001553 [Amaricoccus macauensis]|uniref:Uncharacterized protein n=1 Tax=Amaricoccus macauensis TaxID=57001 RepID=A0A840SIB2_9RHOB|nr:hypothetical protein [Amaricoccus macauensis]MBB5221617.1 hypothetical protein [Amaricoccus macauensis]
MFSIWVLRTQSIAMILASLAAIRLAHRHWFWPWLRRSLTRAVAGVPWNDFPVSDERRYDYSTEVPRNDHAALPTGFADDGGKPRCTPPIAGSNEEPTVQPNHPIAFREFGGEKLFEFVVLVVAVDRMGPGLPKKRTVDRVKSGIARYAGSIGPNALGDFISASRREATEVVGPST